jgi:hypothetical protein
MQTLYTLTSIFILIGAASPAAATSYMVEPGTVIEAVRPGPSTLETLENDRKRQPLPPGEMVMQSPHDLPTSQLGCWLYSARTQQCVRVLITPPRRGRPAQVLLSIPYTFR